jgi:hypothetical protein
MYGTPSLLRLMTKDIRLEEFLVMAVSVKITTPALVFSMMLRIELFPFTRMVFARGLPLPMS